jgi:glycosyltransferase involved in cell wall biosynthesis
MASERILFVDHTGQIGGAELILLDVVAGQDHASVFLFEEGPLANALSERGLKLIISRWGAGLSQFRRDSSWLAAVPLVARLAAIAREIAQAAKAHDLVYANSQKAFVLAAIASVLVKRPLIWHLHDIISAEHFGAVQRRAQVLLANTRATRVIVPSRAAAAAFIAAGGLPDLVEIVPNGLALAPEPSAAGELRQALGFPAGPLVGVFSRLAPWKGQHVLIEALAGLPGVGCIIVGDALFGEQAYASGLKQLVLERGLADRVRFLGHRGDVPRLMKAVDVMVHPSTNAEPFGRTLVEAMLAGVPVIATDAGAAADILDGGKAGMLVAPNDPQALARAIASVLARPEALAAQLAHACARAHTQYSVARMLDSIGLVLRKLKLEAAA